MVDDVVHYCVTNMPGAVARTSTFALNNVTLPFVLALADKGYRRALGEDAHLRNGLNVYRGPGDLPRGGGGAEAEIHAAAKQALRLVTTGSAGSLGRSSADQAALAHARHLVDQGVDRGVNFLHQSS